jgi:hypothetical protein
MEDGWPLSILGLQTATMTAEATTLGRTGDVEVLTAPALKSCTTVPFWLLPFRWPKSLRQLRDYR